MEDSEQNLAMIFFRQSWGFPIDKIDLEKLQTYATSFMIHQRN